MAGDPILASDGPGYRDTAPHLGVDITPPRSCPNCHRLADVTDVMRRYTDRIEAELAAANHRNAVLESRHERTTP
jgi:hypothetical protein